MKKIDKKLVKQFRETNSYTNRYLFRIINQLIVEVNELQDEVFKIKNKEKL